MYGICTQVKPVNAHLNTSSLHLLLLWEKTGKLPRDRPDIIRQLLLMVWLKPLAKTVKEVVEFGTVHH